VKRPSSAARRSGRCREARAGGRRSKCRACIASLATPGTRDTAYSRRCSLTSLPMGGLTAAGLRRGPLAARCARSSLPLELAWQRPQGLPRKSAAEISAGEAGNYESCRQAGEAASPDAGDSRDRSTADPTGHAIPMTSSPRAAMTQRWDEACSRVQIAKARTNSSREVAGVLLFSWTAYCYLRAAITSSSSSVTAVQRQVLLPTVGHAVDVLAGAPMNSLRRWHRIYTR
jgi:hypothetical protein